MKGKYIQICLTWLLLIMGFVGQVKAQGTTVTEFSPVADTWVRSTGTDKDQNYGSDTTLMTRHSSSAYIEIAFLRFDLSSYTLPENAVIDSAKLFMTMVYNQSSGGVVNVLKMSDANDSWDEHSITWNTGRPDTVGGAAAIASIPVARLNPAVASINGISYNWDVTSQAKAEIADGNKLLSMALYPDYKTDVNIRFLSKESALTSLRPKLIIYSHLTDPNSFDISAFSDTYNRQIVLSWKTTNEQNIAYYNVLHSTDGVQFNTLSHVNTSGGVTDTVSYSFQHDLPAQNQTHYYRIETILSDSSRHLSTVVQAAYGITSMVQRNEWIFSQVPSIDATRSRLMQSLQMADFNPVGLRAEPGVPLVVHVDQLSGTGLPKLIVGTYDRQPVHTYTLALGDNTITDADGGDLYIQYSAEIPSHNNQVKVTFQSGFKKMPLYILGSTTHNEWLDQLNYDQSSPNVTLIANRVFIVVSKQSAQSYQQANQDTLLTYMDQIMQVEDEISGLDNSTPLNAPAYGNKLMLLEKASGNPDATSLGRVRIPTGSIRWILDPTYISDGQGGWGIFHEIGHHHQQYPWSWSACTEVTVNIYSMAAKRFFHPGAMGMASSDWDKTMVYLEDTTSAKNYNSSANYVKLGLWNQLGMAFGDSFYHAIHKRTRAEKIVPSGDAAEVRLLMLYACEISGKNLAHFFKQWNVPVDESVYPEIEALGLPAPDTDPTELREDWAVRITRGPDSSSVDSILLVGSAYGPVGVQKVEFYGDGVKIGEATQRPFNFVWKDVPAGSHSVLLKALDKNNEVINSQPLTVIQKAVSITNPMDNSSFASGSSIDLQAATAPGNSVSKVSFYANGLKLAESQSAPYHYTWAAPTAGIYDLKAKVSYQTGGQDTSGAVGVAIGALLPIADGFVRDGNSSNTNYGMDTTLVVKTDVGGYNRVSFIKFAPQSFSAPTDSFKLVLHIHSTNSNVSKTEWQLWLSKSSNWRETDITWNNQPEKDSLLATIATSKTGSVEWTIPGDFHALLATDGTLNLAIVSTTVNGTSDASFYSRNAAAIAYRPRLIPYVQHLQPASLPVTYSPLKATLLGKQVVLHWQSFTESSVRVFKIEHSQDGKHFSVAGREPALGSHSAGHHYQFVHANPTSGINYYRLKELDKSGVVLFSNVATIQVALNQQSHGIKLFPNPIKQGNMLSVILPDQLKTDIFAGIVSLSGKQLYWKRVHPKNVNHIELNTANLQPGIYFVQIQHTNKNGMQPEYKHYKSARFIVY